MKKDQPVKTGSSHIKSVERAILLLEALAQEDTEMSLSQLSQKLGWLAKEHSPRTAGYPP